MELNELNFETVGSWPAATRLICLLVVFLLISVLGYMGLIKPRMASLAQASATQADLQTTYQVKYRQAADLPAYNEQLKQMQVLLRNMLAQLTTPAEIPQLIDSISKLGSANGLEINLVKPDQEVEKDFYAEMPIDISVMGDYHSLALFVSQVASLQKIVTFNDFTISLAKPVTQANAAPGETPKQSVSSKGSNVLVMDATARTYRYIDNPAKDGSAAK